MSTTTRRQNILVTVAAISVVVGSVFLTLYAAGVLSPQGESGGAGYQNVTFTDAVVTCQNTARRDYGERIQNIVIDNHSSRFDDKSYLYKIFMQMDLYGKDKRQAKLHYVNCFVRSSNGSLRKFEVMEDVDAQPGKANDNTNMFGMPKREPKE